MGFQNEGLEKKRYKITPSQARIMIVLLLGAGLVLRIWLTSLTDGHPFDIRTFREWASAAANSLFQVYSGRRPSDYPPLYMYVLYLIGKLGGIPALTPHIVVLLKLPSIFADIATSYLIYKFSKKHLSISASLLLSAFYIFNPAVFINSTVWGQVDSFFTLFIVSAVFCLCEGRIGVSSLLFTAAILMKPQGIIFLPVLFFELIRSRKLGSFLKAAAFSLLAAVAVVLPFAVHYGPMWIINLYSSTLGEYRYASVNAFNFFSLLGANFTNDSTTLFIFSYYIWGMIAIVAVTAISGLIYLKGNNTKFAPGIALLLISGVFTFSSRMHERYLFPAVALAILAYIYIKDRRLLYLAGGFSITSYINTHYILYLTDIGVNQAGFDAILMLTSVMNVFLVCYLVKVLFDDIYIVASRDKCRQIQKNKDG